jgi:RND family efflux transporter MFP subunit
MVPQKTAKVSKPAMIVVKTVAFSLLALIIGILGMTKLASLKKPPAEAKLEERPLRVEARTVTPEDVPVFITGHGEVKALNVVSIAPEVPGKIVKIHPRLEVGEIIPKGELLFKIDPKDYLTIRKISRERLKILKRNHELAKKEYERVRVLFEKNNVGTQTNVESAEKAMLSVADLINQVSQVLETAETNLDRCEVRAPFHARIKSVALEKGQYATPGQSVITLADDSVLEILVPLDSRDARQWLQFNGKRASPGSAWFTELKPVNCKIRWTEDNGSHVWSGRLHRVVKFERQTRTLTVAVRIDATDAVGTGQGLMPLVEGMFCAVQIPGRTLTNVFQIPRQAVSFENTVYTVVANRLKTIPVQVARIEGDYAYISDGLNSGDTVVTTRLIDPLENALIQITNRE